MRFDQSMIERTVRVFDLTDKAIMDSRFIELSKILVNYPADLSSYLFDMKVHYDELFSVGLMMTNRYYNAVIDKETFKSENELLKIEIKKLDAILNFK